MGGKPAFDHKIWETIHGSILDFIMILDRDLIVIYINRIEELGLTKEDVIGTPLYSHAEEKDLQHVKECLESVVKTGKEVVFETTYQQSGNDTIYFESIASPIQNKGDITGLTVISRDITERKHTEKLLQADKDQIELLLSTSSAMVYRCEPKGDYPATFISENIRLILGYEPDDFIKNPDFWSSHIHPKDKERVFAGLAILNKNGQHSHEYRFQHKDGSYRWMLDNLKLIRDEAGKPLDFIGSWIDITSMKRTEEELKKALDETDREKQKSEAIIDALGGAVSIQGHDFKVIFQNKAHRNLIGDHVGEYCYQAYERRDTVCEGCPIAKSFKDGKIHTAQRSAETENGLMHVEITASPLKDQDGKIVASIEVVEDITMRLQLEKEARKTHNLKSLGVLAGGIAHDFNNMLMGIMGNISLAKMHAEPEGKIFNFLNESEKACERATGLTQQLLTFAKGGAPIKLLCSIEDLIRDSVTFILSGSIVKPEFIFESDLLPVKVDPGQVSQVLQNIVKNAEQAMPKGGKIAIHVENATVTKDRKILKKGSYIKIDITDCGSGISVDHLGNIFDPYFTTKRSGTGLGLTVAHSIIQGHNGHISAHSDTKAGSCFSIWLPASPAAPAFEQEKEDPATLLQQGEGKILVMDDDDSVRLVAVSMLVKLGYEVESVEDGDAAIALYEMGLDSGQPFDLVITDLTVPGGMGGERAAKEILKIDPAAKIIVASGYANDPIMADFKDYGFTGVIPKPYRIADLRKLLHDLLNENSK